MSDCYVVHPPVPKDKFVKAVREMGWTISFNGESDWIHNGQSYLHFDIIEGELRAFCRYGVQPTVQDMVSQLEIKLGTLIIIEHDERYWQIMDDDTVILTEA